MFLLERKLQRALDYYRGVPFELWDWNGERRRIGNGPPQFRLHFKTRGALIGSLLESSLGFGEAYARGELLIDGDLEDVLVALAGPDLNLPRRGRLQGLRHSALQSLPVLPLV